MSKTIVVLGGAVSGPAAAARAREIDEEARIILIERNKNVSYAACGLGLYLSGRVGSRAALDSEGPLYLEQNFGVEVRTETAVDAIKAREKRLTIRTGTKSKEIAYEALVYALGAASIQPEEATNLCCFRNLEDLKAIENALERGKRVVVLGAGPLGLEAAGALIERGAEVSILERQPQLLPRAGSAIGGALRELLEKKATVVTGVQNEGFEKDAGLISAVRLEDGRRLECDLVVAAIGLSPRTELLRQAGAHLLRDGTIAVDSRCRTSLPDVFACGVCVSVRRQHGMDWSWIPQASLADRTAQVAGANAAGAEFQMPPASGSMLLQIMDHTYGQTGLPLELARRQYGDRLRIATVFAPATDRFVGNSDSLLLSLLSHESGALLGVEAWGKSGVDKRIDAASAAIAGGLNASALAGLDLSYTPALEPARDPLNIAATVTLLARDGRATPLSAEEFLKGTEYWRVDVSATPLIESDQEIPLENLRARIDELPTDKSLLFISEEGRRALLAARLVSGRRQNNQQCRYLEGGTRLLAMTARAVS